MKIICLIFAAVSGFSSPLFAAENLLANPGVEDELEGWKLAVPSDSEERGAMVEASLQAARTGKFGLLLNCPEAVRYSVYPLEKKVQSLSPAERYCVSVWVRAGKEFVQSPNSPGFYIRVTLDSAPGVTIETGHLFFGLKPRGISGGLSGLRGLGVELVPTKWTKVSAVFEIPSDTTSMTLNFFVDRASGPLYLDDASLTRVGALEELTPLQSE